MGRWKQQNSVLEEIFLDTKGAGHELGGGKDIFWGVFLKTGIQFRETEGVEKWPGLKGGLRKGGRGVGADVY